MRLLGQKDVADLGEILPEFTLNIGDWFCEMDAVLDSTTDAVGDA